MELILYTGLLAVFWTGCYLIVKNGSWIPESVKTYPDWLVRTMDEMFYSVAPKQCRALILILAVVSAITGFFLPQQVSRINIQFSIERASSFNIEREYTEAKQELLEFEDLSIPILQNELGVAYFGLGNLWAAENHLTKAVKLLPDYSKAHYNLYILYKTQNKTSQAGFELVRAKETQSYELSKEQLYGDIKQKGNNFLRFFLAFLLGSAGASLPWAVVRWMKYRRVKKYNNQLIDGLGMMANALRGGMSLFQAIQTVVEESPKPLSEELGMVLKGQQLGEDLDESLENLAKRMPTRETEIFVNAVIILRETGGNLAEIFDTITLTMKERRRVNSKIKTMTAEGETQAVMLAVLPLAMGFLLHHLTPENFNLMYTTFWGWCLIGLGIVMEVVGIFWMLKVVRVKI